MRTSARGFWGRVWDDLQQTELRLWHMVVVGVVSTTITLFGNHFARQDALVLDRSKELVEVSSDFENNVNRFIVSGTTLEGLNAEKLAALLLNVERQISSLNQIKSALSDENELALANDYALTLIEVRDLLQDGIRSGEVRSFGVAAQKLVRTRDKFLARLS